MSAPHVGGACEVFGRRHSEIERVGHAVNDVEVGADEDGVCDGLFADARIP